MAREEENTRMRNVSDGFKIWVNFLAFTFRNEKRIIQIKPKEWIQDSNFRSQY